MSRVVLITGGARGIGRAIAMELAAGGYDVIINYLTSDVAANALREEIIDRFGINCLAVKADISDEQETDRMFKRVENELCSVDILINNAAVDQADLFYRKSAAVFRRTLDVNVIGAFNCSMRAFPLMKEKGFGRIINIASTNGINTYSPMSCDYDASKAALISLSHNLAVQLSPEIHVNVIAPGFIGTESELEGYDEAFLAAECEKILLKRFGKPEEVAHLVSFLISEEADYINNTVIRIDGGQYGSQ